MKLGAHLSTAGGIWKALERAAERQCDVVQLFVKNNMQWFGKPFGPQELDLYANQLASNRFSCVFGHTGYLINLGAPASENRDKSIKSLIQEIHLATDLGLPFLVLHPGAHLDTGEAAGLKAIVAGLDEVLAATVQAPVRIALENTAGQGSCLGARFEHLATIFEGVRQPERLGLCLDTAHLFAAGFDVRTPQGWDAVMEQVDSLLGLEQILAFHLNDSKSDLNSHVDRHANIGQGKLGKEAFRHILNDPRFPNHPGCLETPKPPAPEPEHAQDLAVLRSLLAHPR